jgi:hypothetical protein
MEYRNFDVELPGGKTDSCSPDKSSGGRLHSISGLWKDPRFVIAKDFLRSSGTLLSGALHETLEFNGSMFACKMAISRPLGFRSCE